MKILPKTLLNIFVNLCASLVAQTVKSLPAVRETRVQSLDWEDPWRRKWQPTPVFLPGKPHGQRSLVGYSPWGCKELDTTERLYLLIALSPLLSPPKLLSWRHGGGNIWSMKSLFSLILPHLVTRSG